jgi:hypothetical protein
MKSVNVDLNYFTHPKTTRLLRLLGEGAEAIPIRIWCYCGEHMPEDGVMRGFSVSEIELVGGWKGDPSKALKALKAVGFLDKTEKDSGVHCWLQRQAPLRVMKRLSDQARKKRWEEIGRGVPPRGKRWSDG